MTTTTPAVARQVYEVKDLAELMPISESHIRRLIRTNGHVLGVKPIADVGHRYLFSAALIERALRGESS